VPYLMLVLVERWCTADQAECYNSLRSMEVLETKAKLAAPVVREAMHMMNSELLSANTVLIQALWEGAADAMVLSDPAGMVQAANPAYCQLYGYTPDELIDHSFAIVFPPEQREWALVQYQAVFHTQTPVPVYETTIQRKDGTERLVEARITFITTHGIRTGMLSIIRDITDQRQYLVEQQRLAALVEQAPILISFAAANGHPIYLNRAGQDLLGMIGIDTTWHTSIFDYFQPEDRVLLQHEILPTLMTQGRWVGQVQLLQSKSGALIPVWLEAFRIDYGQTGYPVHIAMIALAR
jgi:PAS domain S-box-containing protein